MFWGNVRTVTYDTRCHAKHVIYFAVNCLQVVFLLFGFIALVSLDSMTFFIIPVICFENAVLYS